MKSYKRGSTQHVLGTAKKFKYVLVVEGLATGAAAGLIAVLYRILLEHAESFVMGAASFIKGNFLYITGWFACLWMLGFLVMKISKWEPLIGGSGIPQVEGEVISFIDQKWYRVLPAKAVSGVMCALGGLSLGREGPSIQLGAMAGKGLAKTFHRPKVEEHLLLTCGAAAGLSAAFNAPLAGVMFALEEVHKNFNMNVLISVMCASITGTFISQNIFGLAPAFHFVVEETMPLHNYGYLLVLGMLAGGLGVVYNQCTIRFQDIVAKCKFLKPGFSIVLAFLIAGVFALFLPQVLGGGHRMIEMLTSNDTMLIKTMAMLLVMKFIFSLISFGSGAPGGIFFPLLVLGSFIGAIFGTIAIRYFGVSSMYMSNFIIVAMAGTFAAIVRAPITGIILIAEMCGTLTHLLPLAVVSIAAYLVATMLNCDPIYESLLHRLLLKNGVSTGEENGEKLLVQNVVELGSHICEKKICEVNWPRHCLIVSIERGGKEIIPDGETTIHCGDILVALLNDRDSAYVKHAFAKCCGVKE